MKKSHFFGDWWFLCDFWCFLMAFLVIFWLGLGNPAILRQNPNKLSVGQFLKKGWDWVILYFIVYKRCSESVGCVIVVGGRKVMYTIENHLFHPAKGAPQKRDDLPRKKGTLLVPFLRCPPSILMGNGGGTPPPPSLFTGAHFGYHLITEWLAGPFIHLLFHLCPKIAFNRTTGRSVNL